MSDKSTTTRSTETMTLSCALTKDELRERGEALAEALGKIEVVQEKKKAAVDSFKGEIENLELTAQVSRRAREA